MTRDARLSALHRGGFGLRGRASLTGTRLRLRFGGHRLGSSEVLRASRGRRLRAAAAGRHSPPRLQDRL